MAVAVMKFPVRLTCEVIGVPIDVLGWADAIARIQAWADSHESRYVCLTNVHSVVTASRNPDFHSVLSCADMVAADGAPVAWMLRRLGYISQERINGPDLMIKYLSAAEKRGESIFLLGSTDETLGLLKFNFSERFPELKIVGAMSLPFSGIDRAFDEELVATINGSGAGTVWVCLGCPKQEYWMARHKGEVSAVMLGVGAAFDFHAGTIKRAPEWMRSTGLEWLFRLWCEPRRLWRRYLTTNTLFLLGVARQISSKWLSRLGC